VPQRGRDGSGRHAGRRPAVQRRARPEHPRHRVGEPPPTARAGRLRRGPGHADIQPEATGRGIRTCTGTHYVPRRSWPGDHRPGHLRRVRASAREALDALRGPGVSHLLVSRIAGTPPQRVVAALDLVPYEDIRGRATKHRLSRDAGGGCCSGPALNNASRMGHPWTCMTALHITRETEASLAPHSSEGRWIANGLDRISGLKR
jgi:hypothetical protein